MKKIGFISVIIMAVSLCIGMAFKYHCRDEGIMDIRTIGDIRELDCNVNQIFTKEDVTSFVNSGKKNFNNLSEQTEIYIVRPTNHLIQYNSTMIQELEIIDIVKGKNAKNEIIRVVEWGGIYDQKHNPVDTFENSNPLFWGMRNLLFSEYQYLIFIEPLALNKYTEMKQYRFENSLFGSFNITSDYSLPIDKPANQIAYNDFGDSEFLCDTQETLDQILELKHSVLERYLP